ncbi:unnamed protein product [Sphenostylis stenocarpa]|uniref:Uncharacterized protein n=1 Tax=Sphenostylis stenocarpa TaxID=92480 RepID=A0AA86VAI8_9FABA|nr:unnamed protein product [Sphenostylis stenocarpa]
MQNITRRSVVEGIQWGFVAGSSTGTCEAIKSRSNSSITNLGTANSNNNILTLFFMAIFVLLVLGRNTRTLGMILFTMLLIIFTILVAFPEFGEAGRALHEDRWLKEYNGILLQALPRGPVIPSMLPEKPYNSWGSHARVGYPVDGGAGAFGSDCKTRTCSLHHFRRNSNGLVQATPDSGEATKMVIMISTSCRTVKRNLL